MQKRSYQKELLDRTDIPFEDIKLNMQELDLINRRLGGHRINLTAIRKLLKGKDDGPVKILEIGCGDGNNLRQIRDWAAKQKMKVELTGIDINPECIQYAQALKENYGINFICADYKEVQPAERPGIIFSSLFCHHFTDEEVIDILKWKNENSTLGFFINDLHRHPLAWLSIKHLTKVFSKSYLVKNDAPLSVARSFRKKEWEELLTAAGIEKWEIGWRWAFRWLVVVRKRQSAL
jgi:2-polyprenyl-3-methyl-5-hydroxy-6-metoxy-1,4-benzoquinol methylase